MSIMDNIVPFIDGEEEKSEQEPAKILGHPIHISAHCNRVPVLDGHLATVSMELDKELAKEEILEAWGSFSGNCETLPSSPARAITYFEEADRPQPRLDRDKDCGMTISVGRLRSCHALSWRFVALSHNTVRGAAGGAILTAELLAEKGFL